MSKIPEPIAYDLVERCPACKSMLYTYYQEASSGDPETGVWYVSCKKCDTDYDDVFPNLTALQTVFTIIEEKP